MLYARSIYAHPVLTKCDQTQKPARFRNSSRHLERFPNSISRNLGSKVKATRLKVSALGNGDQLDSIDPELEKERRRLSLDAKRLKDLRDQYKVDIERARALEFSKLRKCAEDRKAKLFKENEKKKAAKTQKATARRIDMEKRNKRQEETATQWIRKQKEAKILAEEKKTSTIQNLKQYNEKQKEKQKAASKSLISNKLIEKEKKEKMIRMRIDRQKYYARSREAKYEEAKRKKKILKESFKAKQSEWREKRLLNIKEQKDKGILLVDIEDKILQDMTMDKSKLKKFLLLQDLIAQDNLLIQELVESLQVINEEIKSLRLKVPMRFKVFFQIKPSATMAGIREALLKADKEKSRICGDIDSVKKRINENKKQSKKSFGIIRNEISKAAFRSAQNQFAENRDALRRAADERKKASESKRREDISAAREKDIAKRQVQREEFLAKQKAAHERRAERILERRNAWIEKKKSQKRNVDWLNQKIPDSRLPSAALPIIADDKVLLEESSTAINCDNIVSSTVLPVVKEFEIKSTDDGLRSNETLKPND